MTPSLAPEPDDSIRERIRLGLLSVLLIGTPFVFLYWWSGVYSLVAGHIAGSVCCFALLGALPRVSKPKVVGEAGIALLFSVLLYSCTMSGGFYSASFTWFLVIPVGAAVVMGRSVAIRWTALVFATAIAFWTLDFIGMTVEHLVPADQRPVHALANVALAILSVGALVWIFVRGHAESEDRVFDAQKALLKERERLRVLAHYDSLTTLPNRYAFEEILGRCLATTPLALLVVDLDRFKDINDAFGHALGDTVLNEVANCFAQVVYSGPAPKFSALELYDANAMLARRGGDEFVVLMPNASNEEASTLAEALVQSLVEPIDVGEQRLRIAASVGIAMGPSDGSTVKSLVRNADIALSRSKERGTGSVEFFKQGALESVRRRVLVETALRDAIHNKELQLHYQPLFSADETLVGAEALLRWESPILGRVGPHEFIPIAEHSGQMCSIGLWVLETACQEASTWGPELRISVNVSVAQLRGSDLVQAVANVLSSTGLPPGQLELEITESMLADDEHTRSVLRALRELGVSLALDDFGTGFSSLGVLRSLPVECLKIDRSFVQSMHTNLNDAALVRTIIAMGRELGLRVLAEGVEEREQLTALQTVGCDEIQGFLLGKPVDSVTFRKYIEDS